MRSPVLYAGRPIRHCRQPALPALPALQTSPALPAGRFVRAAAAAATVLLCALAPAAPGAAAAPADHLKPCQIDGTSEPALCGTYQVWEDREARRGRKIALNIIVLPALEGPAAADAFTFLEGGPGAAATRDAAGFVQQKDLRRHRDVLLMDQRGTGKSNPLDCDFYGPDSHAKGADPKLLAGELFTSEAVRQCRDRLAKVADLKLYTTALGMDDLDEVRAWLGYAKLDVEGGSYGTEAAQVYMRRHPGAVRTVVLDGVLPLDEPIPLHHAYAGQRAIDLLFAECAAEASCHAAFPHLPEELRAVIQRVEHGVTVSIPDPRTGAMVEVTADRGTIAEGLRFMMYGPNARQVPLAVHQAYEGDLAQLVALAVQRRTELDHILSMGMNFSVTCAEDLPFIDDATAARETAGTMLGDYRVREQKRVCGLWPRGSIPADARQPVRSDLPVLLFSGERDPVTPPEFGERVAKGLTNSLLLIVPHGSHGAEGPCADHLVAEFIERASTKGLDTACIAANPPTRFQTKAQVEVKVDDAILDTYAGSYDVAGQHIALVRRDGHLVLQAAGGPDTNLFPDSENHFFTRGDAIELEFVKGDAGAPPKLVFHYGDQAFKAKRLP
jgi:pimeloyl-ACP methyl ester carboxylesterase